MGDGSTFEYDNSAHPGCSPTMCQRNHPTDAKGDLCGLVGNPPTAWAPHDLQIMLEYHMSHGVRWHNPGFHSGYNEVIFSARSHNHNLPNSVAAFFVLHDNPEGRSWLDYEVDIKAAHRNYLSEYGVSEDDVPLVQFDRGNWEKPFVKIPNAV